MTPIQMLRQRTHTAHSALEQSALARDLMSTDISVARLVAILAVWTSAWVALERCIWGSTFASHVPALLPSRRAHLGQGDLQFWAAQGHTVVVQAAAGHDTFCRVEPVDTASLLGVCYVARGASLGAQVIARHLRAHVPLCTEEGISFFAPATLPALTWPQWSQALNDQLQAPEALARAVVWANATFAALQGAFCASHTMACAVRAIDA